MSGNKPSHIAYVVNKANKPDADDFWCPVGAVFPHGKGNGFDLVLYDQISVWGRIVCIERKDKPTAETEAVGEAQ
jgi:hypothetical protein